MFAEVWAAFSRVPAVCEGDSDDFLLARLTTPQYEPTFAARVRECSSAKQFGWSGRHLRRMDYAHMPGLLPNESSGWKQMAATFQDWPRGRLIVVTAFLAVLVGVLDYVSGKELRFFVFYFIPVSFAAWYLTLGWSVAAALFCTVSWVLVEWLGGMSYSHTLIFLGNGLIRAVSYTLMGYFVWKLKQARLQLKEYAESLEQKVTQRTAKLQERVSEIETFSYAVSHNLRAPLRAIEGMSHVIEERLDGIGKSDFEEPLTRIRSAAVRMDRLILDLVEYVELTIREPEMRVTFVGALAGEVIHQHQGLIEAKQAVIEFESEMPVVLGHNRLLHTVLFQFVSNALKFVDPGKRPKISLGARPAADGFVRVWVRDNGIGIENPHQERIFGLFEQLHIYDLYGGTGMGLAIARKCMDKMGGRIGFESEPNLGSEFWFELKQYKPANQGKA